MNTFYNDERVGQPIRTDDDTQVLVVRRSYPSGSADVAITFAYACAESGAATSLTVELNPKDAHWLAANVQRAAEMCPPNLDDPPF